MSAEAYRMAREIAAWKRKVSAAWDQVRIVDVQRVKIDKEAVCVGEKYQFAVTLDIANLRPEDIGVEMVVARQIVGGQSVNVTRTIQLERTKADGSRVTYSLDYTPDEAGTFDVALRQLRPITFTRRRGAAHLPLEPAPAPPHGLRAGEVGLMPIEGIKFE